MHRFSETNHPSDWRCIMLQNHLSRLFFLSKGCKQVPLDHINRKVLWAHPDGYFLGAQGQKLAHCFNPAKQRGFTKARRTAGGNSGSCYPAMTHFGGKNCHQLMALAFYGERPTYTNKNGKTYVGICHHLIPDKLDYRPANLLCWLTREQHTEADRRQRALRKVLPDMYAISYEKHRYLQDPRTVGREIFDVELEKIRLIYGYNA